MRQHIGRETAFRDLHSYCTKADQVHVPGKLTASFGDIGKSFDDLFDNLDELSRLEALSYHGILQDIGAKTLLDCSCGTGIQSLGLAKLGYQVYASDVSTKMLSALRIKAKQQGITIISKRADFRKLNAWKDKRFDAIISGGNSICVLNNKKEIDEVFASARPLLNPGGALIVGSRDYNILRDAGETIFPRKTRIIDGDPEWIFDIRLFGSRRVKVINFFLRITNGRWRIRTFVKSYLYLSANELSSQMRKYFPHVRILDYKGLHPYTEGEWYLAVGSA